jgi:hypothetical protein
MLARSWAAPRRRRCARKLRPRADALRRDRFVARASMRCCAKPPSTPAQPRMMCTQWIKARQTQSGLGKAAPSHRRKPLKVPANQVFD